MGKSKKNRKQSESDEESDSDDNSPSRKVISEIVDTLSDKKITAREKGLKSLIRKLRFLYIL